MTMILAGQASTHAPQLLQFFSIDARRDQGGRMGGGAAARPKKSLRRESSIAGILTLGALADQR